MRISASRQGDRSIASRLPERSVRRLLLALAAGLILGFTGLRAGAGMGPTFVDPVWLRVTVGGALLVALGCSYLFERWSWSFDGLYQVSLVLLTAWIGGMITWNGFEADSIAVVVILPIISSVAFTVGLDARWRFQLFHAFATTLPVVGVYAVPAPDVDRLLFVVLFGVTMALTYVLVDWRLENRRSMEQVNELLEDEVERRRERERELEESRRRLRRAQRLANVGYWERDLLDDELHWSEEVYRIFGLDEEATAPTYQLLLECIPEDDRREFERMHEGIRSADESFEFEHRVVRPDGEERVVREQAVPVQDEDGKVARIRGSVLDITDLRRRDRQVETLYRLLRHDIRNHGGNILGFLSMVEDDPDVDVLRHAESSARRIVQLTDSVHALMESLGRGEHQRTRVELVDVLEEEIDEIQRVYPDAELCLETPDSSSGPVYADRLVGSVFRNLLYNAVQHSDREAPTVRTSLTVEADRVRVEVADDGPGIPPEIRDRLFRRGAKGPESSGTGLGLYLVRTLVDQYDGEVRAEPNEPRGTVFRVELPRAEAQ